MARSAARSMHDSDMPISQVSLAEEDQHGARFADEGRKGRPLIPTSPLLDLVLAESRRASAPPPSRSLPVTGSPPLGVGLTARRTCSASYPAGRPTAQR